MVKSLRTNYEDTFCKFPGPISLPSRFRWWNLVLIGSALIIFSILGRYLPDNSIELTLYTLGVALGGIVCILGGLVSLLRPGRPCLRLDATSFEVLGPYRKQVFRWSEVSDFGIWSHKRSSFVAFNVAKPRLSISDRLNATLTGGRNATLPDTYGMSVDELVQLMTAWQNSALNAPKSTGS